MRGAAVFWRAPHQLSFQPPCARLPASLPPPSPLPSPPPTPSPTQDDLERMAELMRISVHDSEKLQSDQHWYSSTPLTNSLIPPHTP
eukprot:886475-Pyramimonas_sp.AAC.1